ncbi:hypothetical protein HK097_008479 [Rhizophlyctis rosea]|uniref:Nucleoside phosphorylase domain-containing protein n=1 Tax=Rhizophlyctis rosea TaxID=64517 RepID=A0AAD5X7U6_9FUNG|nr:hypothetical protein HK097_008479 [Rhizophlyctis rosea]
MMDMLVRELRATTDGSLLIARFGSCGGVGEKAEVGTVVVAREGAVMIQRNWDFFASNYDGHDSVESDDPELEKRAWESGKPPYRISGVCPADAELSEVLLDRLRSQLGESRVHAGLNATADSFYSSQGRTDPSFYDFNHNLLTRLPSLIPNVETLEMETFALLHLAKCARASDSVATVGGGAANEGHVVGNVARAESLSSRTGGRRIRATACAMVFADRKGNAFIEPHDVVRLEKSAGRAVLEAVTQCSIE